MRRSDRKVMHIFWLIEALAFCAIIYGLYDGRSVHWVAKPCLSCPGG